MVLHLSIGPGVRRKGIAAWWVNSPCLYSEAGDRIPRHMKAIQVTTPPRFELVELPDPQCGRCQVIVRTAYCGLCGTDLEILRGRIPPGYTRYPLVPGH